MGQKELNITVADGTMIPVKLDKARKTTIGVIHIFHGMAEHMDRYDALVMSLNQQGYDVIRHNHRGHGPTTNQEDLGHIDSFEQVADDAFEIAQTLCTNHEGLPYIIIGHSMGSIIARLFVTKYLDAANGLILSGTGYYSKVTGYTIASILKIITLLFGKSKRLKWVNNLMYKSLNKKITNPKTVSDWISSDEQYVKKYINDEYTGFLVSNQLIYETVSNINKLNKQKYIQKMNKAMPILMISGKDDPLGNYGKGIHRLGKLFKQGRINHVTIQIYKNKRHEILFEREHETIWQHMYDWIQKQILTAK